MKIETINRYICSFCGAEFDNDEREKCENHEKICREEFNRSAYKIKRMCNRRIDSGEKCNLCPFHDCVISGCLLGIPANWKVKMQYD